MPGIVRRTLQKKPRNGDKVGNPGVFGKVDCGGTDWLLSIQAHRPKADNCCDTYQFKDYARLWAPGLMPRTKPGGALRFPQRIARRPRP